jgi:hypothetical protein
MVFTAATILVCVTLVLLLRASRRMAARKEEGLNRTLVNSALATLRPIAAVMLFYAGPATTADTAGPLAPACDGIIDAHLERLPTHRAAQILLALPPRHHQQAMS